MELEVNGAGVVKHMLEGQTVLTYEKPQIGGGNVNNFDASVKRDGELLTGGYLALQAESHPIEFRKVEILNLAGCMDKRAKNYKSYYVQADNTQCRY
jgi:hypothetical protein